MGRRAQQKRAARNVRRHVRERLLAPVELAERKQAEGHDVDVALVTTDLSTASAPFILRCVGCGRTARTWTEPPRGKQPLCPVCIRNGLAG